MTFNTLRRLPVISDLAGVYFVNNPDNSSQNGIYVKPTNSATPTKVGDISGGSASGSQINGYNAGEGSYLLMGSQASGTFGYFPVDGLGSMITGIPGYNVVGSEISGIELYGINWSGSGMSGEYIPGSAIVMSGLHMSGINWDDVLYQGIPGSKVDLTMAGSGIGAYAAAAGAEYLLVGTSMTGRFDFMPLSEFGSYISSFIIGSYIQP